ncbi:MAG: M56 family metallopeptidase [Acidobacteria bacterium]|nr:M56 family metallopeptidase [Acidobacteriota bacterium]
MYIAAQFAASAPAAIAWLAVHSQSVASEVGTTLITAIWQGAVIVCVLEIATRLMPRISASHRFALWSAGFLLTLALPLLSLVDFTGSASPVLATNSAVSNISSHPILQLDARWGLAIAALWLIASVIRAAALAVHSIRLRRLWKAAQPVQISESLRSTFGELRHGRIAICTTQMLDRPSVIGFLAPRILIPEWLLSRLTPGELDQIVLHEAEHLRRADDWTNLIQKLCLVVFPLNPALAWIERRLCREREVACDEGVVRITHAPRAYAACLASLAERRLQRRAEALSLGAWHGRPELVDRVQRILLHKHAMSKTAAGALLAALGTMLLAGSVEMARTPQLIAFVPKHNTQAMTPARQVQLDTLLASETADTKSNLLAAYSAVPAKAVLPDNPSLASAHTAKRKAPKASVSRPAASADSASAQQVANADQLGDRVTSPAPQPQQWVVVTEWREVGSTSLMPQTISDFEQSDPQKAVSQVGESQVQASASTPAQEINPKASTSTATTHQFTVTHLILRVVPASPSSTQPPSTMVRDGWFVIQL